MNPELTSSASLISQLALEVPGFCLLGAGIIHRLLHPSCICVGSGDANPGPHAWAASFLLMGPPLQPPPPLFVVLETGFHVTHHVAEDALELQRLLSPRCWDCMCVPPH